jgi:hypothetical protein
MNSTISFAGNWTNLNGLQFSGSLSNILVFLILPAVVNFFLIVVCIQGKVAQRVAKFFVRLDPDDVSLFLEVFLSTAVLAIGFQGKDYFTVGCDAGPDMRLCFTEVPQPLLISCTYCQPIEFSRKEALAALCNIPANQSSFSAQFDEFCSACKSRSFESKVYIYELTFITAFAVVILFPVIHCHYF